MRVTLASTKNQVGGLGKSRDGAYLTYVLHEVFK